MTNTDQSWQVQTVPQYLPVSCTLHGGVITLLSPTKLESEQWAFYTKLTNPVWIKPKAPKSFKSLKFATIHQLTMAPVFSRPTTRSSTRSNGPVHEEAPALVDHSSSGSDHLDHGPPANDGETNNDGSQDGGNDQGKPDPNDGPNQDGSPNDEAGGDDSDDNKSNSDESAKNSDDEEPEDEEEDGDDEGNDGDDADGNDGDVPQANAPRVVILPPRGNRGPIPHVLNQDHQDQPPEAQNDEPVMQVDDPEEEPEEPAQAEVLQPDGTLFQAPAGWEVVYAERPYKSSAVGFGYRAPDFPETLEVLTTATGHRIACSQPNNLYVRKLLAKIMKAIHESKAPANDPEEASDSDDDDDSTEPKAKSNRTGELTPALAVIKEETEDLMATMALGEEKITDCRQKFMVKIIQGYNQPNGTSNDHLDAILQIYAEIHLGIRHHKVCEFGAAVKAVQEHFLTVIKDNKCVGKGDWTMMVVVLLNEHMKLRGMTPIAFSTDPDLNETVGHQQRRANSTVLWRRFIVEGRERKRKIAVENQPAVIQELIEFLAVAPVPKAANAPGPCDGPPAERPIIERIRNRRRRRSIAEEDLEQE